MGNDSTYTIVVSGGKSDIDELLRYIEEKTERWEKWCAKTEKWSEKRRAKSREEEMKKHGIEKRAGFVTWGFTVDGREDRGNKSTVTLTGWANENSSNCYISGEDGELADLHKRFPYLDYSVDYTDDYSQGFCLAPYFEKQESEEGIDSNGGGILEVENIEAFLESKDGGGAVDPALYEYLGAGAAEYLASNLDRVIDLSGLIYIGEDEAKALAKIPSERLRLGLIVEEEVKRFRRKPKRGKSRSS